jgi:macrodomain Ter protein organizer (MatP/YcbG family)
MAENSKNNRETTSIKIDPDIWKQARIYAINNNMTFSELIEKLIEKELKEKSIRSGE